MILFVLLMQVQVDWRVWLYGMRPGRTFGAPGSESLIMTPEGFLLGVGHSRPYPDIHAVAWALTPEGYTLWQFHQDTVSYDLSLLMGCCASSSGHLYAGGYAVFPGESSSTLFVMRFNPLNGFPIWSYTLPDTAASGSGLFVTDSNGNLIACGDLWTPSTNIDIHAISLDSAGNFRWYFRYDGPWHARDQAHDMTIDPNGDVYIAGIREDSSNPCPTEKKPLVIKLNKSGEAVWVNPINSLLNHTIGTIALSDKWLYVAGSKIPFLARLDTSTGFINFCQEYEGDSGQWVNNMVLDENRNIYIAGGGSPGCWEVMCVDSMGTEKWRFDWNPTEDNGFGMISIGLDPLGNLFVGGSAGKEERPVVYKLDTIGNLVWAWEDTISEYEGVKVSGLVPDGRGGVYAQEWFTFSPDTGLYTNITSVVHLTDGQLIAEDGKKVHGLKALPAPSGFFISGYEGEARIYDPAGRLVISKEIKGKTLISPLSPGIYFVVAGKERAKVAVR